MEVEAVFSGFAAEIDNNTWRVSSYLLHGAPIEHEWLSNVIALYTATLTTPGRTGEKLNCVAVSIDWKSALLHSRTVLLQFSLLFGFADDETTKPCHVTTSIRRHINQYYSSDQKAQG